MVVMCYGFCGVCALTSAGGSRRAAVVFGTALPGHGVRHAAGQQHVHAEGGEAQHLSVVAGELQTAVAAGPVGAILS